MEGDEDSVAIAGWKLFPVVAHHAVRPPVGGKCGNRSDLVRARTHPFAAVTAVLGRKGKLSRHTVVIAFRPAIVAARLQKQQLFGRQSSFLGGLVEVGPIRMQLVSSVLGHEYPAGGVEGKAFSIAYPRCVACCR